MHVEMIDRLTAASNAFTVIAVEPGLSVPLDVLLESDINNDGRVRHK